MAHRSEAAKFLARKVEQSKQQEEERSFSSKPSEVILSEVADAVNFLSARVGLPPECRALVEALMGVSNGNLNWFETNDYELGKRMLGGRAEGKKVESVRKRVQRIRKQLIDWQDESGKRLILYMPGGKDREGNHPSRYKLPILMAASLLFESITETDVGQSHEKMRRESKSHASWLTTDGVSKIDRFRRPNPTVETQIKRNRSLAVNALKKASQLSTLSRFPDPTIDNALDILTNNTRSIVQEDYLVTDD